MTEAVYLKRTINMVDELTLVALGVAFLVGDCRRQRTRDRRKRQTGTGRHFVLGQYQRSRRVLACERGLTAASIDTDFANATQASRGLIGASPRSKAQPRARRLFRNLGPIGHQLKGIRHSAELGKRTRLHLPHQVRAMHLHRRFSDADMVGNLFV